MIIDWPTDVVSDIARRQSVIVLGAGISCNSQNAAGERPKAWAEFLNAATANVPGTQVQRAEILRLVKNRDYLTACQVIRDRMGSAAFHSFAEQEFLTPAYRAAIIHDRISELDSRIVATPNFDTIYENRINHLQGNSVVVKHYYDNDVAESIRGTKRIVLKIHGTINKPNQMIFTRDDYTKARHKYSGFYAILSALIVTQTLVFLGCGLDDPDIKLLLEDYAFRHEYSKPHYFVLPHGKIHHSIAPALEKSLNIKILTYPVSAGNHGQLLTAVEELRDAVSAERASLLLTQNW